MRAAVTDRATSSIIVTRLWSKAGRKVYADRRHAASVEMSGCGDSR